MFSKDYISNYKSTMRLAFPLMLGQLGHMMTNFADSIMVGGLGSKYLAASALASSIFIIFFYFGIGFTFIITPLVGVANGKQDYQECGRLYRSGMYTNLIVGLFLAILTFCSSYILKFLNQPPEVVDLAIPYYQILSLAILPYMVFLTGKSFTEALHNTKIAMYISLICNGINIILNYIWINGLLGFPAMQLNGAGWATTVSRILMSVFITIYIYSVDQYSVIRKTIKWLNFSFKEFKSIFKSGINLAYQSVFEIASFSFAAIIVGWFGTKMLAAHQIAITMASMTYMAASGISSAATIRLSNFKGAKNFQAFKTAGYSAYILAIIFMLCTGTLFIIFNTTIASAFVREHDVIQIAGNFMIIVAVFELFDGIQVVGLGALRGFEDIKIPTLIVVVSYWGFMIPLALVLSKFLGFGAYGVLYSYIIGLFSTALLLFLRYEHIRKKLEIQ